MMSLEFCQYLCFISPEVLCEIPGPSSALDYDKASTACVVYIKD